MREKMTAQKGKKRVLAVQYAGDYREAVERFDRGGEETYSGQKSSVEGFAELGKLVDDLSILICITDEFYDEVLRNGVHAIGAGFNHRISTKELIRLIAQQQPTHLIVNTPIRAVFQWAIKNRIPTIAKLADSFSAQGLRNKIRDFQLSRLLNSKQVEWVFNHNINASRCLQEIGVNPDKIIPWDNPSAVQPYSLSPKKMSTVSATQKLFYAGAIAESKGVGDILRGNFTTEDKKYISSGSDCW